jgi:hypothetical protein
MKYRYPGPQSFTEENEGMFFGRKRETKALLDLILVQPLVVLFAKSGMGKTSLLQAGIVPQFRFTAFDPIIIRLNDFKVPPEQQTIRKISSDLSSGHNSAGKPGEIPIVAPSLWSEIIRYNEEQNGVPLLIFDQFEEIFTLYNEEKRALFVRQLADVVNGTIPSEIRQKIREGIVSRTLDAKAVARLEQSPKAKIVLSIRSDLLHFLHLLSPEIPSILRNRFELTGLRSDQAKEAIVNPAEQAQEVGDYASQAFSYADDALAQILNFLSKRRAATYTDPGKEAEIESFQLQLLCEHIERKVIAGHPQKTVSPLLVTQDFYGGEEGIEQILSQFYSNTLAAITDTLQRNKAHRLLEDHLVKNERRVSVDETTIIETHEVTPATLDLLVNKRLLRQDARETGDYYEISHDTLLTPILKSKSVRETKEAAKKVRHLVLAVLGLLVVLAGAFGFGFWAFKQKAEAEKQKVLADEKSRIAIEQTEKAEAAKARSDSLLNQVLAEQGKTRLALEDAKQKDFARQQAESAKNKLDFDKIYNDAEKLYKARQYPNAKEKYKKALKIAPNMEKVKELEARIKDCDKH